MSRKRKSIPQSPAAVAAAKAKKVDDQLGTLPPRTLVLALYPRYPYFPALVLSHSEARHQKELTRKVKMLEDGEIIGCCVRFFHADTCDVVSAIAIEPLLVNDEDYRLWIWRSSIAQQQRAGWPTFGDDLLDLWKKAFAEAETYAAKLPRITPYVTKEKRGLGEERGSRQVGFLQPGTIVWAYCKDYPIWPAFVAAGDDPPAEASEDETEPLVFIGDDPHGPAVYSSTDDMMGYSPDPCWVDHMRVRSIMAAEERDWKPPSKKDWALWERACTESFALCEPEI